MRAWETRTDTTVSDEPFYGYYLERTGADHPGRDEIIASMAIDWRQIMDRLGLHEDSSHLRTPGRGQREHLATLETIPPTRLRRLCFPTSDT